MIPVDAPALNELVAVGLPVKVMFPMTVQLNVPPPVSVHVGMPAVPRRATTLDDDVPLMFKAFVIVNVPDDGVSTIGEFMLSVVIVLPPPFIVVGHAVPFVFANVTMLYVRPVPQPNVLVLDCAADTTIVEVPALNVRLVEVLQSQTVPNAAEMVKVPLPRFSVRVPVPEFENAVVNVTLGLLTLKSSVPVNAPMVSVVNDFPLMVVSTVTVPPPEEPSNVTLSPLTGADAPPAPPVLADQCVVVVESHVPVPPTQKREAIA